ncbi:MAG: TRAP transporter substrate-binding protein [Candidatus Eremiobacteraeota bacterium]|nr:TRAP transporter substrate-binding protein [Candidatus Eremiobacteraeota bacterium]
MSASPADKDIDWGQNLPSIPSSTGVFWPSIATGILCAVLGLYLIFTPVPDAGNRLDSTSTPVPFSSASPDLLQNDGDVKVLRCGFVDSKDSTFAIGLEEFAKGVEQRTNGELVVELLPGGLVDGRKLAERELVEAVKNGQLAMALSTTSPLSNFNHDLDIFDLPLLFDGFEHVDTVLDGDVGEQLLDSLKEHNLKGLGYMEVGFRIFSSSIPLPDYESFKGKKLRVMQSVTLSRFVKAIGGDPVPAPVNKIYAMGKEGYIDGAGRTYPTYWDFRLYDVHRFISETRHAYSVKMILIDNKLFESLPKEYQRALRESAQAAWVLQRKKQREADQSVKQLALEEGIKIFEMSDEDRKQFVDASVELYDEYRKNQSSELLDKVQAAAKK